MTAGRMRDVVRIEQRAEDQDAAGEPRLSWNLLYERRAEVVRSPGGEVEANQQRQGRVPTTFKLRYLPDLEPGMRLICREKVYDIKSAIDPDGRRRETLITAEERVEELV